MVKIADLPTLINAHNSDGPPSRLFKCWNCLYILLLLAYSALLVLSVEKAYQIVPQTSPYLTEIVNNWNNGIITDILVNQTCPDTYTPIFNYTFPGTITGCNCSSVNPTPTLDFNQMNYGINNHTCTNIEIAAGCTAINSISKASFSQFIPNITLTDDNSNPGSLICILRNNNINWNTQAVISPWKCPVGTIPCGNAASFESRICVDSSIGRCPINSLSTTNLSLTDAYTCHQESTCIILTIFANSSLATVLMWSTTGTSLPIVEFRIDEGTTTCDLISKENLTPNRTLYPLFYQKSSCNIQTDFNYTWRPLFSLNETKLYIYNGMYNNITTLPNFTNYSNYTAQSYQWTLFYRPYFQWSVPYRYYYFHQFINSYQIDSSLRTYQLAERLAIDTTSVILGILLPILLMKDIICTRKTMIRVNKSRKTHKIINFMMKIVQISIFTLASLNSLSKSNLFTFISNNRCITDASYQVTVEIDNIAISFSQINGINVICFLACAAFIFLDVLEYLALCYFNRNNSKGTFRLVPNSPGSSATVRNPGDDVSNIPIFDMGLDSANVSIVRNSADITLEVSKMRSFGIEMTNKTRQNKKFQSSEVGTIESSRDEYRNNRNNANAFVEKSEDVFSLIGGSPTNVVVEISPSPLDFLKSQVKKR